MSVLGVDKTGLSEPNTNSAAHIRKPVQDNSVAAAVELVGGTAKALYEGSVLAKLEGAGNDVSEVEADETAAAKIAQGELNLTNITSGVKAGKIKRRDARALVRAREKEAINANPWMEATIRQTVNDFLGGGSGSTGRGGSGNFLDDPVQVGLQQMVTEAVGNGYYIPPNASPEHLQEILKASQSETANDKTIEQIKSNAEVDKLNREEKGRLVNKAVATGLSNLLVRYRGGLDAIEADPLLDDAQRVAAVKQLTLDTKSGFLSKFGDKQHFIDMDNFNKNFKLFEEYEKLTTDILSDVDAKAIAENKLAMLKAQTDSALFENPHYVQLRSLNKVLGFIDPAWVKPEQRGKMVGILQRFTDEAAEILENPFVDVDPIKLSAEQVKVVGKGYHKLLAELNAGKMENPEAAHAEVAAFVLGQVEGLGVGRIDVDAASALVTTFSDPEWKKYMDSNPKFLDPYRDKIVEAIQVNFRDKLNLGAIKRMGMKNSLMFGKSYADYIEIYRQGNRVDARLKQDTDFSKLPAGGQAMVNQQLNALRTKWATGITNTAKAISNMSGEEHGKVMDDVLAAWEQLSGGEQTEQPSTAETDDSPPTPKELAKYEALAATVEKELGLPDGILRALIWTESRYKKKGPDSPKGAQGLAQIVPKWHPDVDPFNPDEAIPYAGKYLKKMYDQKGTWELALASYNAGPGTVKDYGNTIPPYGETQNYVKNVLALSKKYAAGGTTEQFLYDEALAREKE